MSLTTQANVKLLGGIGGTGDDARIDELILMVDARADGICNRVLSQATFTEYPDIPGVSGTFQLKNPPVTTPITSLHQSTDTPRVYDADSLLVEDTDFIIDPQSGLVYKVSSSWSEKPRAIKVIYQGGYATIPKDLEQAAIETVLYNLPMAREKLYHVTGEEHGDGIIRGVRLQIPMTAQQVFEGYRRVVVR